MSLNSQWASIKKDIESILDGDVAEEILEEFAEAFEDELFRQMPLMDSEGEEYAEHSELYKTVRANAVDLGRSKFVPAQPAMVLSGEAHDRSRFSHEIKDRRGKKVLVITYDDSGVEYMKYHLGDNSLPDGSGGVPTTRPAMKASGKALGPIGMIGGKPIFRRSVGSSTLPVRRWWGPRESAYAAGIARAERKLDNAIARI